MGGRPEAVHGTTLLVKSARASQGIFYNSLHFTLGRLTATRGNSHTAEMFCRRSFCRGSRVGCALRRRLAAARCKNVRYTIPFAQACGTRELHSRVPALTIPIGARELGAVPGSAAAGV